MWSGLTLVPSLFTYAQKFFRISYKITNCRDTVLGTKTFCLVVDLFGIHLAPKVSKNPSRHFKVMGQVKVFNGTVAIRITSR